MGRAGVSVAAVVIRGGRKNTGKRIYPCARADAGLTVVIACDVRIRATGAEVSSCLTISGVAGAANPVFQRLEGVFSP